MNFNCFLLWIYRFLLRGSAHKTVFTKTMLFLQLYVFRNTHLPRSFVITSRIGVTAWSLFATNKNIHPYSLKKKKNLSTTRKLEGKRFQMGVPIKRSVFPSTAYTIPIYCHETNGSMKCFECWVLKQERLPGIYFLVSEYSFSA